MIFSTEDGTIVGFNSAVDPNEGIIAADLSPSGAVFKTLTPGSVNGANYLYASDFHNGNVDVFDQNFQLHTFSQGQFTDPNIPAGFAPFGLKVVNGTLFVTYAKQDAARHDDVAGVGNGFIDEYTLSGTLIERFASQGLLNSPHGIAVAPDNFGPFSNALLVGNFGDSKVNAFNVQTGQFLGQLTDAHGNTLILNGGFKKEPDTKGLWGLTFGDGQNGAATNSLFFAAGIDDENDGLFGKVTVSGEDFGRNGVVTKAPHFYEDYKGPKLDQLNAVAAAGELQPERELPVRRRQQGGARPQGGGDLRLRDRPQRQAAHRAVRQSPGHPVRRAHRGERHARPGDDRQRDRPGEQHVHEPAAGLVLGGRSRDRGERPGEPPPLDGVAAFAVPVQLLARGRRPHLERTDRQLRPRVQ